MDSSSRSSSWTNVYNMLEESVKMLGYTTANTPEEATKNSFEIVGSSTQTQNKLPAKNTEKRDSGGNRTTNSGLIHQSPEVKRGERPEKRPGSGSTASETGYTSDISDISDLPPSRVAFLDNPPVHERAPHRSDTGEEDTEAGKPTNSAEENERGHWKNRMEFLLTLLGYSVGLGNLWRFPYLAYENGGAAFLIPYLIVVVLVGRPLYMSDVCLGQYTQLGPLHTWKRCIPAMSGLGVSLCASALVGSVVYIIVLAYTVYFIYAVLASIGSAVPWSWCDPSWAGDNCYAVGYEVPCSHYNLTKPTAEFNCSEATEGSATLFWRNQILGLDSEGLTTFGDMGEVKWHLVLSLFVIWLIVCLCTIKGIKTVGKVVYFTATFPFIVLLILLIAGMTLPGAGMGLKYLFVPRWEKLLEIKVWRVATEQVLFSMSVGGAGLITLGSYNKFNAKVHIDIVILSVLDLVASLMCAMTIFSVLGAMASELGIDDVSQVVASGPGLAFITYPQAISRTMPMPHFWALLFFLMVLTLGLDSTFAGMETITASITDSFPKLRRYRPLVAITCCTTFFAFGITFCTSKAQYLFYLMDVFGAGMGSLLFCLLKGVTLHWLYGVNRFSNDLKFMLGYGPSIVMKICWAVIAPLTLLSLFVGSLLMWNNPQYGGQVEYPRWAMGVGWCFALFSLSFIPFFLVYEIVKAALKKDVLAAFRPSPLWGPGCPEARARLDRQREQGMEGKPLNTKKKPQNLSEGIPIERILRKEEET